MFLLPGRRAGRWEERTAVRSGARGARARAGAGAGPGLGSEVEAKARLRRRAARRVRGRRGRAGRCVLVGQFRVPRYVGARRPHRDGRPKPQSPRRHPPPARHQWPRPVGAGSLVAPPPPLWLPLRAVPTLARALPWPPLLLPPRRLENRRPALELRNRRRCRLE